MFKLGRLGGVKITQLDSTFLANLPILDSLGHFGGFGPLLAILAHFGPFDNFLRSYSILVIFEYFLRFWSIWVILVILVISDHFSGFGQFSVRYLAPLQRNGLVLISEMSYKSQLSPILSAVFHTLDIA